MARTSGSVSSRTDAHSRASQYSDVSRPGRNRASGARAEAITSSSDSTGPAEKISARLGPTSMP